MSGSPAQGAGRPWRLAAAWLVFLGPFFFITYGFANAHAASLPQVPSVAADWERAIPFLPWTILPYWSIDGFYAASVFVAASRRDRSAAVGDALRLPDN